MKAWKMIFYVKRFGRMETIIYAPRMYEARRMIEQQYGDKLTHIASQVEV